MKYLSDEEAKKLGLPVQSTGVSDKKFISNAEAVELGLKKESVGKSIIASIPRAAASMGLSLAKAVKPDSQPSLNVLGKKVYDPLSTIERNIAPKAQELGERFRAGEITAGGVLSRSIAPSVGAGLSTTLDTAGSFVPGEAFFSSTAKAAKAGFKPFIQSVKPMVKEGALFGGLSGLSQGLRESGDEEGFIKDILKIAGKTLGGTAIGAGGALALGGAGKIASETPGAVRATTSFTKKGLKNIANIPSNIKTNVSASDATKLNLNPFSDLDNSKVLSIKNGDNYVQKKVSEMTQDDISKFQNDTLDKYKNYSQEAKAFQKNRENNSPIELVGKNIDNALKKANNIRIQAGKKMGEVENNFSGKNVSLSGTKVDTFIEEFFKKENKYGTNEADTKKLSKFAEDFDKLSASPTVKETLEFTRTWQNELDNLKDGFGQFKDNKRTYTVMEGAIRDLKDNVRNTIAEGSKEYKQLLRTYRETSKLRDEGNRLLGKEGMLGERLRGGAIAKRAIQSAQDGGSRQFLKSVKKLTGYDGIYDSDIALQAMQDIGDEQGFSLIGAIRDKTESGVTRRIISKIPFGEALTESADILANKIYPAEKRTMNFIKQKYGVSPKTAQKMISEINSGGITDDTLKQVSKERTQFEMAKEAELEQKNIELNNKKEEIYVDMNKSISTIKAIDDVDTLTQHLVKVHNIPEEIASKYAPVLAKLDKVQPLREQFNNIADEVLTFVPKQADQVSETVAKQVDNVKPERFISEESYQKALKNLGDKSTLNSTPIHLGKDALVVAGYHIENGVRSAVELGQKLAEQGYKFTKEQLDELFNNANIRNEAKKYKSAEEFVKAQGTPIYRGEGGSNVAQGKALLAEGKHFASDSEYPKGFGTVSENIIKPTAKVLDLGDSTFAEISQKLGIPERKYISPKELSTIAKEKGYDVLKYNGEYKSTGKQFTHFVDLTGDSTVTKSQLTDIWNKANATPETSLMQEAKKYKSAEEFWKAQGTPVYHGGTELKEVGNMRSKWGAFYMTDNPTYAKSYGGNKSVLNEMVITPEAKLADLRKPSSDIVKQIDEIISPKATSETIKIKKPDGSFIELPKTKGGLSNPVHSSADIIQGIKDGKAYYAEMPEVKEALKKLGYDGMITQESKFGSNYGVWNKNVIKTKSQLTDIWNKAQGGADDLIQEAKKYKSAEEFVNNASSLKERYDWNYLDEMEKNLREGYSISNSDYSYLKKLAEKYRGKEPSEKFYRAGSLNKSSLGEKLNDIYLTDNEGLAKQYANVGGTKVGQYTVISKNPLDATKPETLRNILGEDWRGIQNDQGLKQKLIKYAKDNDYDSVRFPDSGPDGEGTAGNSLVVFSKDQLKTKSQLEQIWNEANNQ